MINVILAILFSTIRNDHSDAFSETDLKRFVIFLVLAIFGSISSVSCKKSDSPPTAPASPPVTILVTATDTITFTPSSHTPTGTGTPSDTFTITPTFTETFTPVTILVTATDTPTGSHTPTFTVTDSPTSSWTPVTILVTATHTATFTDSPTCTPTGTPTLRMTDTPYCIDPFYFGYESGYADGGGVFYQEIVLGRYNLQVPAVVMSLSANLDAMYLGEFRMALYDDNAGNPGALLSQSDTQTVSEDSGWNTVDIPDQSLPAGNYWIALQCPDDGMRSANGLGIGRIVSHSWGDFPDVIPGSNNDSLYRMRANFCPLAPMFTPTQTFVPTQPLTPNPTCITTAASFGITTGLAGNTDDTQVVQYATRGNLPVAGNVRRVQFYASVGTGHGYARVGIYQDSGTAPYPYPTDLIVESTGILYIATTGWYSLDIPVTTLSPGYYWASVMIRPMDIGNTSIGIGMLSGGNNSRVSNLFNAWGDLPSPFGAWSIYNDFLISAEYCTP